SASGCGARAVAERERVRSGSGCGARADTGVRARARAPSRRWSRADGRNASPWREREPMREQARVTARAVARARADGRGPEPMARARAGAGVRARARDRERARAKGAGRAGDGSVRRRASARSTVHPAWSAWRCPPPRSPPRPRPRSRPRLPPRLLRVRPLRSRPQSTLAFACALASAFAFASPPLGALRSCLAVRRRFAADGCARWENRGNRRGRAVCRRVAPAARRRRAAQASGRVGGRAELGRLAPGRAEMRRRVVRGVTGTSPATQYARANRKSCNDDP
ncbi:MAG: hypothetical protein JWO86_5264, partial [Myxococcaceae bacterium]|nr:hypothetical protein [Myxococcaceae bacterium]